MRVFAGVCFWRLPTEAEQTVTCQKFTGTLAFGKLVLMPLPVEKTQQEKDAEAYRAIKNDLVADYVSGSQFKGTELAFIAGCKHGRSTAAKEGK